MTNGTDTENLGADMTVEPDDGGMTVPAIVTALTPAVAGGGGRWTL